MPQSAITTQATPAPDDLKSMTGTTGCSQRLRHDTVASNL